jgi:hypothetical protein
LKNVRLPVLAILLLIALMGRGASGLWAQAGATTGVLTGLVADSEGAPLPDVAVRLINDATGQVQTLNTDISGRYVFPSLNPGSYTLQFSVQGFKTASLFNVTVNVSEETRVDAQMEPGASEDPITCRCTISHLASSAGGSLMSSEEITATPLTSRNVTQTFVTAAGAAGNVNNAGRLGNQNQEVRVSGQGGGGFTIDGAPSGTAPNPDTISQFRIQITQYDAGYGARFPTTNMVTRSGTNDLHGALWEFVRNNMFNANEYFSKALGRPKPDLKQNQFGGALGGPIKQDQIFFFASYQGTRQINGLDATSLSTVILPPLTDDRSAATVASQFCSVPTFAGGVQLACDGSNIHPVALNILQLKLPDGSYVIPTPQIIQSDGLGRSFFSRPSFWNQDQYLGNIDYLMSTKHTLAGRFLYSDADELRTFGAFDSGPAFTPGYPRTFQRSEYVASLKLSTVLTPNLVNEVRMGFNQSRSVAEGPGVPTATSLGMVPANPLFDRVPQMSVRGSSGSFQFFGNYINDRLNEEATYSWADNLSWIHGKHAIRTGVFADMADTDSLQVGNSRGSISFQNFSDFLLGLSAAANGSPENLSNINSVQATLGAGPLGEAQAIRRTITAAAYVQDDIKLLPRFNLNLGLRWEYIPPTWDLVGQLGNYWYSQLALVPIPPASGTYIGNNVGADYDANAINPHTGQPFGPPPAGVFVRPSKGLFDDNGPLNTFAPRIGIAWQPGGNQERLSVRMGYGIFYQPTSNGTFGQAPFTQDLSFSSISNSNSDLSKPFPTTTLGFTLRKPTSQAYHRLAGPEYTVPTVQQWNLTLQTTLLRNLSLDVAYVGSRGTHLVAFRNRNLNQPFLASPAHPVNCGLPNTAAGLGVSDAEFAELGIDASGCVITNTTKNAYLRTPIVGEAPTSLEINDQFASSGYHGLQTSLQKRVSGGLAFRVSYTFSKDMSDTGSWLNDQNDGRQNWFRTNRAHRLVFSYSYELPRPFRSSPVADNLFGGWFISGVTSIQSGSPLTLSDRRGGSVYGRQGNATITLCPGATYRDLQTSGPETSRLNAWFNRQSICSAPVVGSDGLATGYGNAGQSIVNGPGQHVWDMSIGKTTQVGGIREDAQLQLRVEFYNLFNHPVFDDPGTTLGTANFGVVTRTSVAPRLIQFGIKYAF